MNTKWSQQAWEAALPVYEAITKSAFISELIDGTLSLARFIFYLRQDARYIDVYSRVLAHIASRVPTTDMLESFLSFAADGVAVEKYMHASYLEGLGAAEEMSPACLLYTSFLQSKTLAPVEVEAAAILPCFWVYWAIGKYITGKVASTDAHPYGTWIATYSDPAFDTSNARAIEICDELASRASDEVRQAMTDAFVEATRLEWLFWHSAYNLEKRPI